MDTAHLQLEAERGVSQHLPHGVSLLPRASAHGIVLSTLSVSLHTSINLYIISHRHSQKLIPLVI